MNTPNNQRRRNSVAKIEKAFLTLLQDRELSKVTVSDICKMASVNRSTFYANFLDVYDLADRIRVHLEEEVKRLYDPEISQQFNSHDYLKLFRHIQENQLFYKIYFKLGYDNEHAVELYDVERAQRDFDNRYIHYHIAFFKNGFNAIVKMWLENGCSETPEEMEEIIISEYRGRD